MATVKIQQTGEPSCSSANVPANRVYRILVVDDEACMRHLNSELLMSAGYDVDAVKDGSAAWDALQQSSYDLLITDNNMPKMSGVDLLKKMRAGEVTIPVIMATGTRPAEDDSSWTAPDITLIKPYKASEFLAAVKNVLSADNTPDGE